ncbi:translocation/assembly module TamB domain-containing protein, partial [Chamaesiphon polymorphus]
MKIEPQHQSTPCQLTNNSSYSSRRWLKLFLKTGSAIGLVLFLLAIVALGFGQWWAKDNLIPIVDRELTKSLKRPVNLGKLQDIWFNEIHIKNAKIPTNGRDLNQIVAPDVYVSFNPFKLLFDRSLKLDVRLASPQIELAQNTQGNWLNIPPQEKQPPPPIKIEVGTIKIDDARMTIVPYSQVPQPITVSKINLQADVNDRQDRVTFNGGAQFQENGQVNFKGNSSIASGATELSVKGQKLDAFAATRIVKIPEVTIASGTVDGDLSLAIQPQKDLRINSNLLVNNGKIVINNVPKSLDEVNGFINVSERAVKFNNVTTKYDRVAGVVSGDLNYSTGYNLSAQTAPITLPDVFKSIDVKSPFPLAGTAVAQLQLTGKLDRPILAGRFNNTQISQVDRVQVERVDGNFKLADGRITLDAIAQPKLGGKVTTQGEIQLLKIPRTSFQVQGNNLPGDALSRLYGAKLPTQLKIGNAAVRGTIAGTGEAIFTNLKIDAPQATYPVSTDLQITPQGKTIVRGATLSAAGGTVRATGEITPTNWRLNLQPQAVDTQQLAQLNGVKLPPNYSGKLDGNVRVAGLNNDIDIDRIQASGNLNLQLPAGTVIADRINLDRGVWKANVSSNALDLRQLVADSIDSNNLDPASPSKNQLPPGVISGNFNLSGNNLKQITPENIQAQGQGKFKLKTGEIQSQNLTIANGNWQGLFTANRLPLSALAPKVGGQLSGSAQLAGNLKSFAPESLRGVGKGEIVLPQGKIVGNNLQIDRGKWQGNLQASSLVIGSLAPEVPLKFKDAKLDGNFKVAGDIQQLKPENINVTGSGNLSLAAGNVLARQLELNAGKWRGDFEVDRLKLGDINTEIPTKFNSARLSGKFIANGDLDRVNLDRLQVAGDGELKLADGSIRATGLKLAGGNLSSNLAIANFQLGNLNTQLDPQLKAGKISGNFNISANVNKLTPTTIQASGNGKLKLANGGEINANNFQTNAGAWQSDLTANGLQLGTVNRQLPAAIKVGLLSGSFKAAGNLKTPELAKIQASGNGRISNILGGNIQVNNLAIDNGQWQGNTIADRLNIGELVKFAPPNVAAAIGANSPPENRLAGQLSAQWQLRGNLQENSLANLLVSGQTKLTNFQIGALKFERNLTGNVRANPGEGVDIDFAGENDRLALTLDRNLQPQSFALKQQDITANGNVDGKILGIDVQRLPITLLLPWIPKNAGIQQYRFGGNATGNLAIDLNNLQVTGKQIEIIDPIFGAFQGERLAGDFRYANGQLALDRTEIQRGKHTYQLDASISPGASTPTFQAKLQVPSGELEDIRNILQIFSTNDLFKPFPQRKYGTAADLNTKPERLASRPYSLNDQLRRLSELRRWLNRDADRQADEKLIPDLGNLQGEFSGEISLSNSPKTGLRSDFKIAGTKWQLESYRLDRILAQGNWRDGKLRLEPLDLTIEDSQISIAGDFGIDNQNAKVNVKNFPVQALASLVELPIDIDGAIDLSAQIGGELANPRISGDVVLNDGALNATKLQDVTGNFNYWDGRLNFTSDANFAKSPIVSQQDRIKITGSIPYQLPFALQAPASNDINIDLSLQNQGLQAIDVLSKQQLSWLDGQGKIALKIQGQMKPGGEGIETLTASGTANITKGRIQSVALPEPLTDVNADIIFDFDRVEVQKFTGKFNRGQVSIAGIIPISDSFSIEPSQQLGIQMNGVAVDVKEKYKGDVNGKLTILGTALNPVLSGDIQLSNGQVFLPETPNTT